MVEFSVEYRSRQGRYGKVGSKSQRVTFSVTFLDIQDARTAAGTDGRAGPTTQIPVLLGSMKQGKIHGRGFALKLRKSSLELILQFLP